MTERTIKPISPAEIDDIQYIPDWVIEAANECIINHYKVATRTSHFTQNVLIEYYLKHAPEGVERQTIFDEHWLDIEPLYRKEGWIVKYDSPACGEFYESNFSFEKPK